MIQLTNVDLFNTNLDNFKFNLNGSKYQYGIKGLEKPLTEMKKDFEKPQQLGLF